MGGKEHRIFPVSVTVSFSYEKSAIIGVLPSNQWIMLFCQAGFNLPVLLTLLLIYSDVGRQRRRFSDSFLTHSTEKNTLYHGKQTEEFFSSIAFSLNYDKQE